MEIRRSTRVEELPGVGKVRAAALAKLGLHTAEEIQTGDRPAARRAEGQLSGDTDREMRRYMQDLHRNRR